MAAIAASPLDLGNKAPRRQGMTRHTSFASLHGPRLESQRVKGEAFQEMARDRRGGGDEDSTRAHREGSEDDIYAPPKDSSDESDVRATEKEDDDGWASFDDLAPVSRKSKVPIVPSSAPARTFSPEPVPQNKARRNGASARTLSQDVVSRSPKRRSDQISEDDKQDDDNDINDLFTMSQQEKKHRAGYGASKKSRLTATTSEKMKKPKTEPLLKPGSQDKLRTAAVSALSAKEAPKLRKPVIPALPEPQNASAKSTEDGIHNTKPERSQREFRKMAKTSPGKRAVLRKALTETAKTGEDASAKTRTRPRRGPCKCEPRSSDVDVLKNQDSASLILDASRRLGMPEPTIKLPPASALTGSPKAQSSATSPLSSPATSIFDDDDFIAANSPQSKQPSISSSPPTALCPVCRTPVDRLFFEGEVGTRLLKMPEQIAFCKRHHLRSAQEEWTARGLPEIDWSRVGERVTAHHDVLAEIIEGTRQSFYRNAYEELLRRTDTRGGRRPLFRMGQQSLAQVDDVEEMAAPGYYGSRGARIMIENIMTRFASHLRRRAPHDPLISGKGFFVPSDGKDNTGSNIGGMATTKSTIVGNSGTGIDGYVQAVLVPETATLLVREDLEQSALSSDFPTPCTAETARQLLRDTVKLGELLCEELEDDDIQDDDADAEEMVMV